MELWVHLYNDTDTLTRGWLRHAAQLLQDCTAAASAAPEAAATSAGAELPASRRVANILVSAGQLVATLAKLLLFRLDRFFPIQSEDNLSVLIPGNLHRDIFRRSNSSLERPPPGSPSSCVPASCPIVVYHCQLNCFCPDESEGDLQLDSLCRCHVC